MNIQMRVLNLDYLNKWCYMNNDKYKLVGYFNYFDVIPCSVYPIYMDNNKELYWAFSDNGDINDCECYFTKFLKLPEEYKKHVKYLNNCIVKIDNEQDSYQLGDLIVCGIEIENNVAYMGPIDKYVDFIQNYKEDFVKPGDYEFKEEFIKELESEISFIEEILNKAKEKGILDQIKQKKKRKKRRR